jgi:hypothetical protein
MEGRAPASLWDRGRFVRRRGAPPSMTTRLSILLPNLPHKLLDKVVVLNKESASVNAPLPLHGKVNIRY